MRACTWAPADAIDKPGWMSRSCYETHHYHQPSGDQTDVELRGMIRTRSVAIGDAIANGADAPAFVPGDEFARIRR